MTAPSARVRRKNAKQVTRKERELRSDRAALRRMTEAQIIEEAEQVIARQAHIDQSGEEPYFEEHGFAAHPRKCLCGLTFLNMDLVEIHVARMWRAEDQTVGEY